MAIIEIKTTPEEQKKVLAALRELQGDTVALSRVAKEAKNLFWRMQLPETARWRLP